MGFAQICMDIRTTFFREQCSYLWYTIPQMTRFSASWFMLVIQDAFVCTMLVFVSGLISPASGQSRVRAGFLTDATRVCWEPCELKPLPLV